MKPYEIEVKNDEDGRKVALSHTVCPTCGQRLNDSWECEKCGIFLIFVSEYDRSKQE